MAVVMENQQPVAPTAMQVVPTPPHLPPPPPPPPLPPPPQAYKHRCKVCKKGFVCGRALGGHMRAHGVADDGLSADDVLDDDDEEGPGGGAWDSSEEAAAAAATTTTKRMYSLRTNAGRHKNCRVCENCGKEFTSWKSLLDHGRCKQDDLSIDIDDEDEEDLALAAGGWLKGKRTRRTKVIVVENGSQIDEPLSVVSREEEDLANWLVMLASSRAREVQPQAIVDAHQQTPASTSKHKDERTSTTVRKDEERFLVPPQPISILPPTLPRFKFLAPPQVIPSPVVARGLFECKACKKVFTSHQALGGHRASHKKVKGCFAAKLAENTRNDSSPQPSTSSSNNNNNIINNVKIVVEAIPAIVDTTAESANGADGNTEAGSMMVNARTTAVVAASSAPEMAIMQVDEAPSSSTAPPPFKKKGKVHECSVCHRVFMSGQALGGHKRCHWITTGSAGEPAVVTKQLPFVTQDHVMQAVCQHQQLTLGSTVYGTSDSCLDLNDVPMNQSADHPGATSRQAAGELNESMLSLNAPASLYMHSWPAARTNASNMLNPAATSGHYDGLPEAAGTDDEADSTSAKRAKISDLKDMNMAGETSSWLQVGIALPSDTNERLLKPKG